MNNLWRFLGVLALAGMVQNGWSAERSELPVTLSALPETAEGRWETLTPPAVKIIAGNNSSVSELKLEFDGSMTGIAQLPLTILPQQRSKDGSVRGQV
ncbi:MAG: hypothetical protein RRY34_03940, partial [Victivallaceae bacterium]